MMRKAAVIAAMIMVALLFENWAQAGVGIIMNGSFERDGRSIDYITENDAPYGWCDVNLPEDDFGASLWSDWSTHGNYYLTIYSYDWGTFEAEDTGTISQQVYLEDVNEIIFDLKLDTGYGEPWNPAMRSAVLLIDGDVVWESNSAGSDVRGEYFNQIYTVEEEYQDANLHTLSLGLRANSSVPDYIEYYSQWDFIKFDTYCGGFGYLPGDLNLDCYVDINDLAVLAGQWLAEEPGEKYDLFQDDEAIINFLDFTVLADEWMDNTDWKNWPDCFELELLDADLNDDGIINLCDLAILANDWTSEGNCIRSDIDESGVVDYGDISELADEWLQKSWLYKLN